MCTVTEILSPVTEILSPKFVVTEICVTEVCPICALSPKFCHRNSHRNSHSSIYYFFSAQVFLLKVPCNRIYRVSLMGCSPVHTIEKKGDAFHVLKEL